VILKIHLCGDKLRLNYFNSFGADFDKSGHKGPGAEGYLGIHR